ncbi:hypothetical protein RhiirA1_482337, partial [Rhizophagus irregularis]
MSRSRPQIFALARRVVNDELSFAYGPSFVIFYAYRELPEHSGCFWLTYYYWNHNNQQQQPFTTSPQYPFPAQTPSQTPNQTQQMTTPAFPSTASMAPAGIPTFTTSAGGARGEESYIENILRLNRGKEA